MSWRSLRVGVPLVACLFASTGCAAGPEDRPEEAVGAAHEAIMGGNPDYADSSVVGIYDLKLNDLCSGSLIAPNVVLTARHCVAPVENTDAQGSVLCGTTTFGANFAPDHFAVTAKENLFDTSADHHVREVATPPDSDFCGNDVAILILDSTIIAPEASGLVPRIDEPIAKTNEYSAIGYGAIDDSQAGTGAGTRRRRDGLTVTCVAGDCPKSFVTSTEWEGQEGICHGDSGGPAIDNLGRVTGVTSRGGANCTAPVYGYVFSWADWLKDTTVHAAELANIKPPPWATGWPTNPDYSYPVGNPCKSPVDCDSGYCLNDGVASYCTRSCNEQAPCEKGYTCEAQDSVCAQVHSPTKPGEPSGSSGCTVSPCSGADPRDLAPWALLAIALVRRRSARSSPRS